MKFLTTLVSVVLDFDAWSVCLDLDLCPLVWKLGLGLDLPEEGDMPERRLSINIPTLRFEVRWMRQSELETFLSKLG